jgi:8-oxo-dGTP diphosphatase
MQLDDIDWTTWTPKDVATLLFIRRRHELLLIRKKRGLGAGKINAPGGRLEPGETPEQAAIREVEEEVLVTPGGVRKRGELRFQFVDGYSLHCHVFLADSFKGEPGETDEAEPLWISIAEIPYDEMWADDTLWLPKVLAGYGFTARSTFDGETMLSFDMELDDPAEPLFARLAELNIPVETHDHAPVFTVEQAQAARVRHDGVHVKNLFLRNKKGGMWLVVLPEDQKVDLKALAAELGAGRVSFGSATRLHQNLGVEPGSVTPFAALNDVAGKVIVAVGGAVLDADVVHCHPLTCDRTTALSGAGLARFLESTGHTPVRI